MLEKRDFKVLYVEDNKGVLNETKELFENFFSEIVTATNGVEALEKYDNSFDIVITDLKMPKMDGIELAKKIKEIEKNQEIIVISAYDDSDKLLSLIKIGVSDFILKPIDFNQLINVFDKVSSNVLSKKLEQQFLIQQQKLATMGEMLDIVAHQWLQFINALSVKTELFEYENSIKNLNQLEIQNYINYYENQIKELWETLQEFREFFKDKDKEIVNLKTFVEKTLLLLKDYLIQNGIEIKMELDEKIQFSIYPNQFKQVIINIIQNMVEAYLENSNIQEKIIKIYFDNGLCLEDNAGGIKELNKIFDKKFTTKKDGSGVGLYISKIIMDRVGGIEAENSNNGAKFRLKVKDGIL